MATEIVCRRLGRHVDRALSISLSWTDVVDDGIEATLDRFQTERWTPNDLYFTKNQDWKSEGEFRIVCSRWNVAETEEHKPLPIAYGSSLRGIVLGEHFPEAEGALIASRMDSQTELGVVRCEWHSGVQSCLQCERTEPHLPLPTSSGDHQPIHV